MRKAIRLLHFGGLRKIGKPRIQRIPGEKGTLQGEKIYRGTAAALLHRSRIGSLPQTTNRNRLISLSLFMCSHRFSQFAPSANVLD